MVTVEKRVEVTSVSDLSIRGSISIDSFLTEFNYFAWKDSCYVEEVISDYVRINMIRITDNYASIFAYFDVYEDGIEREIDPMDIEEGFVEVYGEGYKCTEMVHWGVSINDMNVERTTFYVHREDWHALHSYLSVLQDEDWDARDAEFEIIDRRLKVNDEFEIIIHD